MRRQLLFHLAEQESWQACQDEGHYSPESLVREGFIHLSTKAQLLLSAERFFADVDQVVVAAIDRSLLRAPLREEPADGQLFPHLYGALNLDAVLALIRLERDQEGRFTMPGGF